MNRTDLAQWVAGALGADLAGRPGAVLFSGIGAIRPGPVYLMGLNPGGDPTAAGHRTPIRDALAPPDGYSCYLNECWRCGPGDVCDHLVEGRLRAGAAKPHQQRVTALAELLGYAGPAELPSANAVFARSSDLASLSRQTGLNVWQWWDRCWPVHQRLLAIVRPRVIITLGHGLDSSALGLLAHRAGVARGAIDRVGDAGVGGGKRFRAALPLSDSILDVDVIGIPHPSYYASGPQMQACLRQAVEEHR